MNNNNNNNIIEKILNNNISIFTIGDNGHSINITEIIRNTIIELQQQNDIYKEKLNDAHFIISNTSCGLSYSEFYEDTQQEVLEILKY